MKTLNICLFFKLENFFIFVLSILGFRAKKKAAIDPKKFSMSVMSVLK